ncbi:tellurite resistance TerB family protein [Aquimarina agarilytica]|uniref:tellurite resistance TerB family protein n=1 Tax=Aquimarina agarilytica TaxID=1087449 RepID=UPI0002886FEC|nr:TerB family tellurite resistance protein [Aquimarina agarilytica]
MSFNDLFDSGKHKKNLGHFASIVTLAAADGAVNENELSLLKRFARKLDVDDSEFEEILKTPKRYPINPPNNSGERLERLYDLFKIIYADNSMDEIESKLIKKYAIGLGFSAESTESLIKKSIELFSGKIKFDDYNTIINSL